MRKKPHLVVGASGFVGSALCEKLRSSEVEFLEVRRSNPQVTTDVATIYYCAGVTGDFLSDPENTIEANCSFLSQLAKTLRFDSLVYLSSGRINLGESAPMADASVTIDPTNIDHLYNASKVLGELTARVLAARHGASIQIVRLSNVLGFDPDSPNFFWQIARAVRKSGAVSLRTSPESTRDYVWLDDVVDFLSRLSAREGAEIHYAASNHHVSTAEVIAMFERRTDCIVDVLESAPTIRAPRYPNDSFREILGRAPTDPRKILERLAERFLCEDVNSTP